MLLAINMTTIDFFSFDIEGAEFTILKQIPWDKIDIKVYYILDIFKKIEKCFICKMKCS